MFDRLDDILIHYEELMQELTVLPWQKTRTVSAS